MKRKRAHVPLIERLASILADQLDRAVRDELRAKKVPAAHIVRMFTPDHIKLHAWGGEDKWHNLTMRLRDETLKRKDAADTSRAAKAVRIDEKWSEFTRAMRSGKKPTKPKSNWPKRKMQWRKRGERS